MNDYSPSWWKVIVVSVAVVGSGIGVIWSNRRAVSEEEIQAAVKAVIGDDVPSDVKDKLDLFISAFRDPRTGDLVTPVQVSYELRALRDEVAALKADGQP